MAGSAPGTRASKWYLLSVSASPGDGLPCLPHSQVCFFRVQQALWEKLPQIFWILLPPPDLVDEEKLPFQARDGDRSRGFTQPTPPFPVCMQVQTRAHVCTTATPCAYTQLFRSLFTSVQPTPNSVLCGKSTLQVSDILRLLDDGGGARLPSPLPHINHAGLRMNTATRIEPMEPVFICLLPRVDCHECHS